MTTTLAPSTQKHFSPPMNRSYISTIILWTETTKPWKLIRSSYCHENTLSCTWVMQSNQLHSHKEGSIVGGGAGG
jgi:hypothetical protein